MGSEATTMARVRNASAGAAGRLVPTDLSKALAKSKGSGIDSGSLLSALIDIWGGPREFARDIFAEFSAAKAGSMTRQRILEMATRLTVQVTSQEIARPRTPAEMSDDELAERARVLLEKMYGPAPGPPSPAQAAGPGTAG
jgi:hypothetical protein